MMNPQTVQHPATVDAYIRHGWSLVPIQPGTKAPQGLGWNRPGAHLRSQADLPPGHGIGLAHAYSGTMALDLDDWDAATTMLAMFGIDLQALYDAPDAVVIDSSNPGHGKLLYSMPFGLALPTRKISADKTIFELRCATADGLTVQDVLPPSVHPGTGQPYRWAGRGHWSRLPMIPEALLNLWQSMNDAPVIEQAAPVTASWDEIRSAIEAISPDCSREDWITVGMALHYASVADGDASKGLPIWDAWSSKSPAKYPGERAIQAQWRSFRADKGEKITTASLFHLAQQAGWVRPAVDVKHLFGPVREAVTGIDGEAALRPAVDPAWFPKVLADRALEVSRTVGCDPIVPLWAGLAAACGAVTAQSRLELMRGYQVPPILWLMTIGSPADKKTPGSSPMVEPLHALEDEDTPHWRKRLLEWEGREALYNAQKKDFLEAASTGIGTMAGAIPHVDDLPPQPQKLKIKVSDITSQKLVRYCADRPRGLLCYLDEMAGWAKKMNDRNTTEDRSAWVQAYEGRRYEYDRVGGGSVVADVFAVSVYGNIQPQVYQDCSTSLSADGLLQRFIPGLLDTTLTRRGDPLDDGTLSDRWEQTIRLIYALPEQVYTLSDEAYTVFREFQLWFERTKQDEAVMEADARFMTGLGKLEGTTARIALIFHLIESPFTTSVSADTMRRAITLTRKYILPALRYLATGKAESMGRWVMNWLLYHADNRAEVTLSEVKRAGRRKLEGVNSLWVQDRMVLDAMAELEDAGWLIRTDDGSKEHLHYASWAVNPNIQTLDKKRVRVIIARQRQEDERRRIAGLPRKLIRGYEEWMEPELLADDRPLWDWQNTGTE